MLNRIFVFLPLFVCIGASSYAREFRSTVQCVELQSGWRFQEASQGVWHPAVVPGNVHADLLRNGVIPDPFFGENERTLQWIGEKDWVYQTTFAVSGELLGRDNVTLLFKGLDTYARVTLNDSVVLAADNMFREWRVECKKLLRPHGNVISIRFRNVFDEVMPKYKNAPFQLQAYPNNDQADVKIAMYARKAQFHFGWDWGPRLVTCGIWRPVLLEAWDDFRIQSVHFQQPRVDAEEAEIRAVVEILSASDKAVSLSLSANDTVLARSTVQLKKGLNEIVQTGRIGHPRLWWTNRLGGQYLYNMRALVSSSGGRSDEYSAHIGVRSLEVVREKDSLGTSLFVRLNGVPVFMKGANYIPQDNLQNRVTPQRYEHIVKSAADANMNMLRVWGGGIYEEDLFYDLCDRYGILLWHDLMFACAMYPVDQAFLESVRAELKDNIRRLRNHASIALYCGNNENEISWYAWGWKQKYPPDIQAIAERNLRMLFQEVIPAAVREADPTRYYHQTSPIAGYGDRSANDGDIHYWGVWHGNEPFETYENVTARFISEYGFQSYPEMATLRAFTLPEDRQLHSPAMLSHQRCMADERRDREYGNRLIRNAMDRYYKTPAGFPMYVYAGQVLQAEGVRVAMEAHRRGMPACMGTLYWQINDCWPAASWSSIDYFGRWKALHYAARRAYAPLLVSPALKDSILSITIVSDRRDTVRGDLNVQVMDFAGRSVYTAALRVVALPASAYLHARMPVRLLIGDRDPAGLVLIARLETEGETAAEAIRYFVAPKALRLQKPEIGIKTGRSGDGWNVTLSSNVLAKSVYVFTDDGAGHFDDNYFDLLPGQTKTLQYAGGPADGDPAGRMRVVSLIDSYAGTSGQ
jgi:beta-mannosidase